MAGLATADPADEVAENKPCTTTAAAVPVLAGRAAPSALSVSTEKHHFL